MQGAGRQEARKEGESQFWGFFPPFSSLFTPFSQNKYKYFIARPATAMRGAASTAGTVPAGWLPLGSQVTNTISQGLLSFTPNFPAYPSGHATFGSAAFQVCVGGVCERE